MKQVLLAMRMNTGRLSPILPPLVSGMAPVCLRDHRRGGIWVQLKALGSGISKEKAKTAVTRPSAPEWPIVNVCGRRWPKPKVVEENMKGNPDGSVHKGSDRSVAKENNENVAARMPMKARQLPWAPSA